MPRVSIIVPALRPDFLDACISSALAQTFGDFELLVGDDSAGDDVFSVLSKWEDPRVRYARNPNRGVPGANRDMLVKLASGQFIKFLFDDDLLLPRSVEMLLKVADATDAKLVFHGNYVIDEIGRTHPNPLLIPEGQLAEPTREAFFQTAITPGVNFVGGPVNILIATEVLRSMPTAFGLDGERMRFLGDVALYANMLDQGHRMLGIGARLSAFRFHGAQTSNQNSPVHVAGLFEWELLARWSADRWPITGEQAVAAIEACHERYRAHIVRYPQLQRFIDLGAAPDSSGRLCTESFRDLLAECRAEIDAAGSLVPHNQGS